MNLQESIRRILRETVNGSTFFRRRVDMSLLDEEFYKNLNIVTDRFLMLSSGKQSYSFNEFRTTVISYLIDDYRDNLSDQDYDNLPYDEVYEYLSNHFHDKIKDRYDEVFGGYINESKNIRRVLQEETNYLRMLLRRLPTETLDNIDKEFDSSLNYMSKIFITEYKSHPNKLSESKFIRMVITDFLSIIEARHYLPDDIQWSNDLTNELTDKYKGRIRSMYRVLNK